MLKNHPPILRPTGLANCQILVLESVDRPRHAPLVMDRNSKKWCFAPRSQKMCWKKTCVKMFGCLQAKMQFEEFAEMVKHRSEPCCPWKQWPFFICLHQQLVFTEILSSLSESRIKKPRAGKQGFASNTRNYNCSKAIADYSPEESCGRCIWFYCSAASLVTGAPLLEVFSISSHNSSFHWNTDSSHLLGYHAPQRANLRTCPSVQQRFSNHFFDASSNCFRLPAPQPE